MSSYRSILRIDNLSGKIGSGSFGAIHLGRGPKRVDQDLVPDFSRSECSDFLSGANLWGCHAWTQILRCESSDRRRGRHQIRAFEVKATLWDSMPWFGSFGNTSQSDLNDLSLVC